MTQIEMTPVMLDYMEKIAESSGGPGGEAMGQMMQIMMLAGIGFWIVWTLIKIGIMAWAAIYLNRESTKNFFAAAA